MYETLTYDKTLSSYQPGEEVTKLTSSVKKDYGTGESILNRQWVELNNRSVIEDENRGQMMFNAFVDTSVEDQSEVWKWRGTRSAARNKGVAMHANLTANFLFCSFSAQNDDDETDEEFAEVMRDIVMWMASPDNSNYESSFMQVTNGMLTNPVTFLGAEYIEVFQKIKEKNENGEKVTKEVLDTVLSGFDAPIYSSSQVLITNAYERNIQRQRRIIKRRYTEKCDLEAKYGDHPNWQFVQDGIRSIYNEEDGLFYDVKDNTRPLTICSEEIALGRQEDMEVPFVNGIYLGDMDDVDFNPIRHRDNKGNPKYNVIPFGYSRIGEHFFYYKSMMNIMGWDNDLYDAQTEVLMNRALLETEMPIAISGSDNIDSEVIFPNAVVAFENADTKVTHLLPPSNMAAGFNALAATKQSMDESSVNEVTSGQLPDASQKAYNVAQAQAAAKKLVGAVAKSMAESILQYGSLMKDVAINHVTVPEVDMLVGDGMRLKYRTFVMPNKTTGKGKRIVFDQSLIGKDMTEAERKDANLKILTDSGYPNHKEDLIIINPELFANFNFLARADIDEMFAKNSDYWQPVLLNLKTALALDPYTNQEALTKELMRSYFQSRANDFVNEKPAPSAQPIQPDPNALSGATPGLPVQKPALSTGMMNAS